MFQELQMLQHISAISACCQAKIAVQIDRVIDYSTVRHAVEGEKRFGYYSTVYKRILVTPVGLVQLERSSMAL